MQAIDSAEENRREKAFREAFQKAGSLPTSPEMELLLNGAISVLSKMDTTGTGIAPERFREKKKGRPQVVRSDAIVIITGTAYFYVTNKIPALTNSTYSEHFDDKVMPGGPFFELLSDVFEILGIEASCEHLIKKHVANFREGMKIPAKNIAKKT